MKMHDEIDLLIAEKMGPPGVVRGTALPTILRPRRDLAARVERVADLVIRDQRGPEEYQGFRARYRGGNDGPKRRASPAKKAARKAVAKARKANRGRK